jgi:hypothetical protein
MYTSEMGQLQAINRLVESVAERDLSLLNTIDKTIDIFLQSRGEMDVFTKVAYNFIEEIKGFSEALDEDGAIVRALEKNRDTLGFLHAKLIKQCEAVEGSHKIHVEDGLAEEYRAMIDSVAALHNAINALAWAVGEHDADFDEPMPGGPYSNAEDLFAAMGI